MPLRLLMKPPAGRRRPPLPVLLPLLIGATLLTGAALLAQPTVAFLLKAERAEGRYVGAITATGGSHGGAFYHPRFRFAARDGTIVTFTARSGSTGRTYADGDRVTVYYDPLQPADARLNGVLEQWMGPLLLGAAGLVALAVGAALVARWRRRNVS